MILILAQTKGGVGKSTLAINLAIARAMAGRDVLLVDADEQATAADFTALRAEKLGGPGYTAISLTGAAVRTQVLRLTDKWTLSSMQVAGIPRACALASRLRIPLSCRSSPAPLTSGPWTRSSHC